MDKFEEQTQRKEFLINRLNEIRLYKSINKIHKESVEYVQLRDEQFIIEAELTTIRIFFRDATKQTRHEANQLYLKTHPKVEKLRAKVIPVYIDDYTGERCEYCGGKMNNGLCANSSPEWPHAPISLLSNVQSIVSTESVSV